jgi:hypothetical protein
MRNTRRIPIKSVRRRLDVEEKLVDYPDLSADKLLDLIYWFKREATVMELAAIASNPRVRDNYRQFRARYLGKLTMGETVLATVLGAGLIVMIAAAAALS